MLSDVDVPTLRAIAKSTGGRYFRATDSDTIDQAFAAIDRERKIEFDAKANLNVQEFYAWAAWPGLLSLLAGYSLITRRRRAAAPRSLPAQAPSMADQRPTLFA
jgi:Ca-activated chloride channel family protein